MHTKSALRSLALTLAGTLFAASVFAAPAGPQWQWLDQAGRKVYSDRSPPPEIPEKNILKRPGGQLVRPALVEVPDATATSKAATPAAAAPKLTGKDRELEAKKKQAEQDEAAKKKAEEEKVAVAKADACDRAKKGLTTLQSGIRIASVNSKGEREIMDDNARAAETKRLQGVADSSCN